MSEDERRMPGARVSAIGVHVGPTDPGKLDLEDDLPRGERGSGQIL